MEIPDGLSVDSYLISVANLQTVKQQEGSTKCKSKSKISSFYGTLEGSGTTTK